MKFEYFQILIFQSLLLFTTNAKTIQTCSTIQLEAYCDIQTTSYTSIYQKQELYEYDDNYINIMSNLEKKSDSSISKSSSRSIGFKGLSFSGSKGTNKLLKTYFKKSYNIVTHKIKEKYNSNEKKHTFQAGIFQYFRVIHSTLSVDGNVYETTTQDLVYSSPNFDEYEKVIDRYCPRQMRREFKTKELDYDSGALEVCFDEPAPEKPKMPFNNLSGWTKINSDISKHLYYKLMDHKGPVDFLGAVATCKEYRKDSHLAETQSLKEYQELRKIAAHRNKQYWLNGYNNKSSAHRRSDYIWLHSGKPVPSHSSMWFPGDGMNGSERVFAFSREGQGFWDVTPGWRYQSGGFYAVCELRMD